MTKNSTNDSSNRPSSFQIKICETNLEKPNSQCCLTNTTSKKNYFSKTTTSTRSKYYFKRKNALLLNEKEDFKNMLLQIIPHQKINKQ
jgi:hypothetical protein